MNLRHTHKTPHGIQCKCNTVTSNCFTKFNSNFSRVSHKLAIMYDYDLLFENVGKFFFCNRREKEIHCSCDELQSGPKRHQS